MHVISLMLTISLGAFGSTLDGCASTSLMIDTQWPFSPSSFSGASSFPLPITSFSLMPPPTMHMMW
ncbi:hypothetical protein B296_00006921 [Ensete ventricosum]|uniref:Secreted protein n=1 Tax=Ensete ventricosum TaxID=4639 RepID=A0A426ZJ88_ENSVE|nr:hypothetical protein B296_00006921 [Ensete ventricosum]